MMRRSEVRALREEHGPEGFLQIEAALLEGRELPNGRKVKARPEQFSIRALWEGLVGPVEDTLAFARDQGGFQEVIVTEAVGTGAFPSAVGQLVAAKVIEGYESPGFIGDELVTTMPSKLRGERLVGFTSLQGPKPVGEGAAYEESTFREKYVTTT